MQETAPGNSGALQAGHCVAPAPGAAGMLGSEKSIVPLVDTEALVGVRAEPDWLPAPGREPLGAGTANTLAHLALGQRACLPAAVSGI